jgi:hypothetical protein
VADAADSALIGTVLGDVYRVTRLIGRGGMGAVYEGVHQRLSRPVAVKLMARELAANPEALARFRREAEVTSQLGHPHIVQVFDFGEAPTGEPYLVMEYLVGEDLEQRLRRVGRLPAAQAAHIVKQIASALAATHAKGIVHRDLKPANVFVLAVEGETDFVKVVDFGISKVKAATTRLTAASVVMGTPNYMSPEQATGRIDEIDSSTDQWALACIAYEMLAGRPPFVGENVASLLYQVVHQAPSPLAALAPGLPPGIEEVLGCALAKSKTERFASLTAFARAFETAAGVAPGAGGAMEAAALSATAASPSMVVAASRPATVSEPEKPKATTFSAAAGEAIAPDATLNKGRIFSRAAVGTGLAAAVVLGGVLTMTLRHPSGPERVSGAPVAVPAQAAITAPVAPATRPPDPVPSPARTGALAAPAPEAPSAPPRTRRKTAKVVHPVAEPSPAGPAAPAAPAPAPPVAKTKPEADTPSWPLPSNQPAADPGSNGATDVPPAGTSAPPRQRRHLFRDLKHKLLD